MYLCAKIIDFASFCDFLLGVWECFDIPGSLLCFSFNLIMFYFISTPGISVMINNEIFINDPNRTPSMSLGNRTGTHIDAGRYTCYVDNSLLHCTNYTRFNMEANRHYLIIVCYWSDTLIHILVCPACVESCVFLFFPDKKNKTTPMQMQKRNESSFGFPKCIMYIPSPRFLCRLTAYMDLL